MILRRTIYLSLTLFAAAIAGLQPHVNGVTLVMMVIIVILVSLIYNSFPDEYDL